MHAVQGNITNINGSSFICNAQALSPIITKIMNKRISLLVCDQTLFFQENVSRV